MTMTSKIIAVISDHVKDYEVSISMAEERENLVNGLRSLKNIKKFDEYKLRDAVYFQGLYEGEAKTSRMAAHKLYDAFKDDFNSNERSEVDKLMSGI